MRRIIPVEVSLMVPLVTPFDELQMKPRLFDHWNVNGELVEVQRKAPCLLTFQNAGSQGVSRKPQTVSPIVRDGIRVPTMVRGPAAVGKAQSQNTSSIVLMLSRLRQRQAAPLKSPATKSMF